MTIDKYLVITTVLCLVAFFPEEVPLLRPFLQLKATAKKGVVSLHNTNS